MRVHPSRSSCRGREMTIPRWLLPAICVIAAIAVGIAAAIVSGRLAPAEVVESAIEPTTTETTLYGPSGFGDDEDLIELPAEGVGVSPEVGVIEVSTGLPADPGVTPLADATERIADGGAAGDDIPTVSGDETAVGAASTGDEPATPAEDPCFAAGDCPEGTVTGRIFALVSPPEYQVRIRAFPPDGLCPAAPVGDANLLVFMTRPSDVTVTVEQLGGGSIQSFEQSTAAALEESWNAALAEAEGVGELPFLFLCVTARAVEPGTSYLATVSGEARGDGTVASDSTEFNGAGPTHHPTLSIEPIGDGAAVAYAEHTVDEQVAIRAWRMPDDFAGTPDCFRPAEGATEIDWRSRSYGTLTPEETGNLLIPPEYDQRTAVGFAVPEGSTILFCATWHPGAEAPSWERVQATFADGALLRTTDYVLPRVTLVRVDLDDDVEVDELTVFGRTQEGMQCGGFGFDPADEASVLPHVVCDLEGASTTFDVHDWSFRDLGFSGNIVIPTRLMIDGDAVTDEVTLNLGDLMCLGGCPSNPTTRYTIPLPEVGGAPAGSVTLQVSWVQGGSNGLVRPMVSDVPQRGELVAESAGGVLPWATPMMDTDERMSYSRIDSSSLSGVASLHLVTDRPVDYTVTLTGLRGETCAVGGATLVATGHSEGVTDVEVPGLCFGQFYWATVVLSDEHGGSTTFAANRGGVTQWNASLVRVPKAELRLSYAAATVTPADSAVVPGSSITIDGTVIPLGARTCTDTGGLTSSGVVVVPVSSRPVVDVHIATTPALTDDGVSCSGLVTPESTTVVADGTTTLDLESIREARGGATTITIGGLTLVLSVLA